LYGLNTVKSDIKLCFLAASNTVASDCQFQIIGHSNRSLHLWLDHKTKFWHKNWLGNVVRDRFIINKHV